MNRRLFLRAAGGAAALAAAPALGKPAPSDEPERLLHLERFFPAPVRIARVEALRARGVYFIRVVSESGAFGVSVGNLRFPYLLSLFEGLAAPFFAGQDARDIETLIDAVGRAERNYKYAALPFWSVVGQIEWAVFDLLGRLAGRPAYTFFGEALRTRVPAYLSTFTRDRSAEATLAELDGPVARTGVRAVKIKIGGRMGPDLLPGRSEALIPLARKHFGEGMELYADCNGSYDVPGGIRIGRLLEDAGFAIVEEPCHWEDFAGTKAVADALRMTVAGGEQDTSFPKWRWLCENRALDLVQPDLVYNGGFIRSVRVARLAASLGLPISPHASSTGPEAALKLQFAAVTPNLGGFQEAREEPADADAWYEPVLRLRNGFVEIPAGPGLGIAYDEALWRGAERVGCSAAG